MFKKGYTPWNKGIPCTEECKKAISSSLNRVIRQQKHMQEKLQKNHSKNTGGLLRTFIYPVLNDSHRKYGASILLSPILRENGDWRNFIPNFESQNRGGLDSIACYIEGSQHTIATIEETKFGEVDNNYSARFNALLSGGTPTGGDPVKGADSIINDGLIPEAMMTYEGLNSWEDFHSWKGVDEGHCRAIGKADLYLNHRTFGVVITRGLPLKTKYQILREGLKRSPMPISIYAVPDGRGSYIEKPEGVWDTHLVEALHCSTEGVITILDTYEPFIKQLPANYPMDFGMAWRVEKRVHKPNWLADLLSRFFGILQSVWKQEEPKPEKTEPIPAPKHPTPQELLKMLCVDNLGKDLSDRADNELGCANVVSNILREIYPDFPSFISTRAMWLHLLDDKRFKGTLSLDPWSIIVSPTGKGNAKVPNGHIGVLGEGGIIYSNNSATGLFDTHLTVEKWIQKYRTQGGYPIYLFKLV